MEKPYLAPVQDIYLLLMMNKAWYVATLKSLHLNINTRNVAVFTNRIISFNSCIQFNSLKRHVFKVIEDALFLYYS